MSHTCCVLDRVQYNTFGWELFLFGNSVCNCFTISSSAVCVKRGIIVCQCWCNWWSECDVGGSKVCFFFYIYESLRSRIREYIHTYIHICNGEWRPSNEGSTPDRGTRVFSSPQRSVRAWGPPNLLCNGYWGLISLGWWVKQPGRVAHHTTRTSTPAHVLNERSRGTIRTAEIAKHVEFHYHAH
jgi:hypothetical protein